MSADVEVEVASGRAGSSNVADVLAVVAAVDVVVVKCVNAHAEPRPEAPEVVRGDAVVPDEGVEGPNVEPPGRRLPRTEISWTKSWTHS